MEAVMNFLELARERYSCRQLSNRKVEKEKLDKIIEALPPMRSLIKYGL